MQTAEFDSGPETDGDIVYVLSTCTECNATNNNRDYVSVCYLFGYVWGGQESLENRAERREIKDA